MGEIHDIVWGAGYRRVRDRLHGDVNTVSFDPSERDDALYNIFLQDEIRLRPDLHLTLGAKFEHNPVSEVEPQPSVRLLWQLSDRQTLWTVWSWAVRTPSRSDRDIRLNLSGFPLVSFQGSPDYDTERMDAYEAGFRHQPPSTFGYDVTAFYGSSDRGSRGRIPSDHPALV